jgi:hypothetical protein
VGGGPHAQPDPLREVWSKGLGTAVRGLRWRTSASYKHSSIFVNRDGNAARNIHKLLMCGPDNRPAHLSHFSGLAKPVAEGVASIPE